MYIQLNRKSMASGVSSSKQYGENSERRSVTESNGSRWLAGVSSAISAASANGGSQRRGAGSQR